MDPAPQHVTTIQLEQSLAEVLNSPAENGVLNAIYVRPRKDERQSLMAAELTAEKGIVGDRWELDHWKQLPDGRSDPDSQVSIMNARILGAIAANENAMALAGDNLILDFDITEQNLPIGSRIQIGDQVILQISAEAHTGCWKFSRRFGKDANRFDNHPEYKQLHLRGRYGRIIQGGTIRVGDKVAKVCV
jgi:hypothetical protein